MTRRPPKYSVMTSEKPDQQEHQRPHDGLHAGQDEVLLADSPSSASGSRPISYSSRTYALHDADAERFSCARVVSSEYCLLPLLELLVHQLPQTVDGERNERQRDQREQRQLPVLVSMIARTIVNVISVSAGYMMPGPERVAHGADVVRRVRHQVAGRRVLVEREREALDMREEIVAQVVLDVPRDDDDGLPGQEREDAGHEREADDEPGVEQEIARREAALFRGPVFSASIARPTNSGLCHREEVARPRRSECRERGSSVPRKVRKETEQGFHAAHPMTSNPV